MLMTRMAVSPSNPFKRNRQVHRYTPSWQGLCLGFTGILAVYLFGKLRALKSTISLPLRTANTSDETVTTTQFEVDPDVAKLVALQQNPQDQDAIEAANDDFGLVLITGWPPTNDVKSFFTEFQRLVRQCFEPQDLDNSHGPASVYLCPPQYLHVTVTTLHSLIIPTRDNPEQRQVLTQHWRDILMRAALRPEWPTEPLELVIDSARIGARAGIILWKETTGGLEKMRQCIRQETDERKDELIQVGIDPSTLKIPNIVHSTFLRFYRIPTTSEAVVQERFNQNVLPRLRQAFSAPVTFNDTKLICELMPNVHFPNDDRHVLLRTPIASHEELMK